MRKILSALIVCLLAASALLAAPRHPRIGQKRAGGPAITFENGAVVASEATPGATVHFASLTLGGADYVTVVEKPAGSAVADSGGVARFTPQPALRKRSIWIAVDGASGGFTVASPSALLREIDFPGAGLHKGKGNSIRKIALRRYGVDFFLIRPGHDVWTAYFRDGRRGDDDRAIDGSTDADIESLKSSSGVPAPKAFEKGDVLFVVDRNSLEFFAAVNGK